MISTTAKSPVPMYVCMCVVIRCPRVHHARTLDAAPVLGKGLIQL